MLALDKQGGYLSEFTINFGNLASQIGCEIVSAHQNKSMLKLVIKI